MRKEFQKGMFEAFHILKKIADNLKKPVEQYGNCPPLHDLGSEVCAHNHMYMYFSCIDAKTQWV